MKAYTAFWVILLLPMPLIAAPDAVLWPFWQQADSRNTEKIDHQIWQEWLHGYVEKGESDSSRVNYAKVTVADKQRLQNYIHRLAATPIRSYNSEEQRAFWINLYNALTVHLILEHYPVSSITEIDISPGLFSNGPWGKKLIRIEGQSLSLDDIEHRILRPIWQDPRIHYALNCASVGCPDLQQTAFTAENSEQLLAENARRFINSPRGARFVKGKLVVSKIYTWFQADFGSSEQAVIEHLSIYANNRLKTMLEGRYRIDRYEYDWRLNDSTLSNRP